MSATVRFSLALAAGGVAGDLAGYADSGSSWTYLGLLTSGWVLTQFFRGPVAPETQWLCDTCGGPGHFFSAGEHCPGVPAELPAARALPGKPRALATCGCDGCRP